MTAPDARQPDELREALAERLVPFFWSTGDSDAVIAEILPVVTAWADRQARERAAEELESWARSFRAVGTAAIRRENRRVYPQVAAVLEAGARDLRDPAALSAAGQPRPDDGEGR